MRGEWVGEGCRLGQDGLDGDKLNHKPNVMSHSNKVHQKETDSEPPFGLVATVRKNYVGYKLGDKLSAKLEQSACETISLISSKPTRFATKNHIPPQLFLTIFRGYLRGQNLVSKNIGKSLLDPKWTPNY